MEETLGKRIAANRKRLGITQERLAEQLGVTAQAVSKWENDQSCPDITTLPKLAGIFGISVDALLGISAAEEEPVRTGEIVIEEIEPEESGNNWEFHWDAERKGSIRFAVWVLLAGALMLGNVIFGWNAEIWGILWPSALAVFGLSGIYPEFSFFRLICGLLGGYFLLDNLKLVSFELDSNLILPVLVILIGLSLLVQALRKPNKFHISSSHNGNSLKKKGFSFLTDKDSFCCKCAFCENRQAVNLPLLREGEIETGFGQLTIDLTTVQEFAPGCHIDVECAFGNLTLLVPSRIRAEVDSDAAFGSVEIHGSSDSDAAVILRIDADCSFGQVVVEYV